MRQIIPRIDHIHARVGHPQGPQVSDPALPEWQDAVQHHLKWWDAIVDHRQKSGSAYLTLTPEFGPIPYMQLIPFTQQPIANQWDINLYMVNLLKSRYNSFV